MIDCIGKLWKITLPMTPYLDSLHDIKLSSMEGRDVKSLGVGNHFIVAVCEVLNPGQSQPLLHKIGDFSKPIIEILEC
jgi:hypothetical protein